MSASDLDGIEMRNGVNERGEPFITVIARSRSGAMWLGQLTPQEARDHAMAYLATAEAAEQDAAVLRCVRKLDLPDELAGMVISELRDSRD